MPKEKNKQTSYKNRNKEHGKKKVLLKNIYFKKIFRENSIIILFKLTYEE